MATSSLGMFWEGGSAFSHHLTEMVERANKAAAGFVTEGSHAIERQAKINASSGRHAAGTPTPATPGSGPAIITGTLRRSIHVDGPRPLGLGTWQAKTGPSAIYGRRVELEFNYPYMGPALRFVRSIVLPKLARKWFEGVR